jgi:hypothetical protein
MSEYIECSCGCSILRMEYDSEYDQYYFSIYEIKGKMPLRYKLRVLWKMFKDGTPYGDQLVFEQSQAKQIVEFINKCMLSNVIVKR